MGDYNGWTNYETWIIALGVDNNAASVSLYRDLAKDCKVEAAAQAPHEVFTVAEHATFLLADVAKRQHEDKLPELATPYAELMRSGLDRVNWREIAEHLLAE